jgi:hypothetical protein
MSKTCPSSRCEEGALLLGTVREDGTIAFAAEPRVVSRTFAEAAQAAGEPERRFRFAGPCVAQQCGQWTAGKCGVPGAVAKLLAEFEHDRKAAPEHCAIRPTCRWFAQESYAACALCPLVTTERETAAI